MQMLKPCHQHHCTRSLCSLRPSPAHPCFSPTPVFTSGFPDFSSIRHLPEAAPAELVAVSKTHLTQTFLLAIGREKRIAGANSASEQLCAAMGMRGAIHSISAYFFPLFSASSLRNFNQSHSDSLLILQSWPVSPGTPCRDREGEQNDVAQLCWQLPVCVPLCGSRGERSLGLA